MINNCLCFSRGFGSSSGRSAGDRPRDSARRYENGAASRGFTGAAKRDDLNLMSLHRPNFSNMDLKSFHKEFYNEMPIVSNKSQVFFITDLLKFNKLN